MTPAEARAARIGDPLQYSETMLALLVARPLSSLPYAISGREGRDAAAIAAVRDLEAAGLVRRTRVRCDGEIVELAVRLAGASSAQRLEAA